MKNIILDTNAYSFLQKGDSSINKVILSSSKVYVSVVTLGELYRGFEIGNKELQNNNRLNMFLKGKNIEIAEINIKTAKIYGKISGLLKRQGTPLPINDVWIAASAIEKDLVLVTYDKHFLKIPKVKLWKKLNH